MNVAARGGRLVRRRAGGTAGPGTPARRSRPPTARSAPNSGFRTALQKHVDFFDTNHDGRFYNGSLFYELADEVAARRAHGRAGLLRVVAGHVRELY